MFESGMEEKADILVIDDDNEAAAAILKALEPEGYSVFKAATAEMGLIMAKKLDPLLIFVNLSVPGSTGLDMCGSLKDMLDEVPIVLLTLVDGTFNPQYRDLYGIAGFIKKPLGSEAVIGKIREVLAPVEALEAEGAHHDPFETDDPYEADDFAPAIEEKTESKEAAPRWAEETMRLDEIETVTEKAPLEDDEYGEPPDFEAQAEDRGIIEEAPPAEDDFPQGFPDVDEPEAQTADAPPEERVSSPKPEPEPWAEPPEERVSSPKPEPEPWAEPPEERVSSPKPEPEPWAEPPEEDFSPAKETDFEDEGEEAYFMPKKKKSALKTLIPILAVSVLLGVGFAVYWVFFKSPASPPPPTAVQEAPALLNVPLPSAQSNAPAEETAPAEAPAVKEVSRPAKTAYYVQFGLFSQKGNADKLVRSLKAEDIGAFVQGDRHKGKKVFRVLQGGYKSKGQALRASERLRRSKGFDCSVYERRAS